MGCRMVDVHPAEVIPKELRFSNVSIAAAERRGWQIGKTRRNVGIFMSRVADHRVLSPAQALAAADRLEHPRNWCESSARKMIRRPAVFLHSIARRPR